MNTYRKSAIVAGALFLIAMVASLSGAGVLESVLGAPDYLASVAANEGQILAGMFLEFTNGIAVLGIAIALFPALRRHNETLAIGYVGFRVVETVFCILAAVVPLSIVALSQGYIQAGAPDSSYFQALGAMALAERAHLAGLLIPISLGLGALLLYYVFYQSRLVPRFIAVWGFIGVALMLALNLLGTIGIDIDTSIAMILVFPIILNEIFLAIWLIVKGFDSVAIASGSS